MIVEEDDQILAIMKSGKVIRSNVAEVKRTGRNTQGVTFAKPDKNDEILSIARNEDKEDSEESAESASADAAASAADNGIAESSANAAGANATASAAESNDAE